MMKNLVHNIKQLLPIALVALIVFSGCTLSMEDWIEKEEDKGYDNLEKVEYDGLKLEYQYKDETRSLTSNILEYLISTDGDTILHFMDNMPEEYRPRLGGYVAAFCCDELPVGINARVVSIDHKDGMLNVEVTPVPYEDTYKEFKLDMDMQLRFTHDDDSDRSKVSGRRHKSRAMKPSDDDSNVIVDWATYDYMVSGGKQKTRGGDYDFSEDAEIDDKETTNETLIIDENLSSGDFFKELKNNPDMSKWVSLIPDFKIALYTVEKIRIKKKIDVAKKLESTSTYTSKGYRVAVSLGSGFDILSLVKENPKVGEAIKNVIKKGVKSAEMLSKFKDGAFAYQIPLTVPCVIRVKPDVSFTPALIGSADCTIWTDEGHTFTLAVDGKIVEDSKPISHAGPPNEISFNAMGEVSLKGGIELFAGVGVVKAPNQVIGIGVSADVTAEVKLAFAGTIDGDKTIANSKDGLTATLSFGIGGKAIAGKWIDFNFAHKSWDILKAKGFQYFPTLGYSDVKVKHGSDEKGKYRELVFAYYVKELGGHFDEWYKTHLPSLYVEEYQELFGVSTGIAYTKMLTPDEASVNKTEKGKWYHFTYRTYAGNNKIKVTPCLKYTKSDKKDDVYFPNFKEEIPGILYPTVEYKLENDGDDYRHLYQMKGTYRNIVSRNVKEFSYTLALPFTLSNAGAIDDVWEDWGLYWTAIAYDKEGKAEALPGRYRSLKGAIKKSGTYNVQQGFFYETPGYQPKMQVRAILYYVPKGKVEKKFIEGPDAEKYLINPISFSSKSGYIKVPDYYEFSNDFRTKNIPSWLQKLKKVTAK